jgi:hypothetical protein
MTSRKDKLAEYERAWADADTNYVDDVLATGQDRSLKQAVDRNWWRHQANWADAATAALERNSAAIDAAFQAAKQANDDVEARRKAAGDFAKLVKASGQAASALSKLLDEVAK